MGGQVSAVSLFSRVSSDGGVVRQARSPRCFAERESIVLFFPFPRASSSAPFSHILHLYSIPAKCQDPWGRCTKSALHSQLVKNDGACRRHRVKSPLHAFALDAILLSGGNVFISWKNNSNAWRAATVSNMDPSSVDGSPCLVGQTRSPPPCRVSHAAAAFFPSFLAQRIHDAHCWLLM